MKMRRRDFLSGLLAAAVASGPARAQDFVASVVAQLRKQGFQSIIEERTLLGRVRLSAKRKDGLREIIINPRNGEILRDLWTPSSRTAGDIKIIEDRSGSMGRGGSDDSGGGDDGHGGKGDDDDDEDDEGDDEGDDGDDDDEDGDHEGEDGHEDGGGDGDKGNGGD